MKIITIRDVIRGVPSSFNRQYQNYKDDAVIGMGDGRTAVGDTKRRLAALDVETASVTDVDAAVGNIGWASLTCDECGQEKEAIVQIGDEPGYEARWQNLCADCLDDALKLLRT